MMTFAALAGVMVLVSIVIVVLPLWRGDSAHGSRREANIAVYEQHTAVIDREVAAGQITQAQGDSHREELGARLLEDVEQGGMAFAGNRGDTPWLSSTMVVIAIVVSAAGMYTMLGDPRGVTAPERPDIARLVGEMKTRLATTPDDLRTRALLAQVQMVQHKYAAAAQSLAVINANMDKPDVTFLLTEARARVLGNGGDVNARAQQLYHQVLRLAPDNTEALWFAGLAALDDGNDSVAIIHWQRLLRQDLPKDFREQVERRLAELTEAKPSLGAGR